MENRILRLAHEGHDPSDLWVVAGLGHTKVNMENLDIKDISTLAEYEAGCKDHESCPGELCRTPYGTLLPMQSLAISTAVMKNDIAKVAVAAFGGSGKYYQNLSRSLLEASLKRKTGRMRKGIVNCHVDGSLRMIITPQTEDAPNVMMIPRYLSETWRVVYFDESTNKYKSRYVKDGDNAIAIRPPSLSVRSVQPVIVKYWDQTCMGISPYLVKAFDGDYDGDEMHLFPVYSPDSIQECSRWNITPNHAFDEAKRIYQSSSIPFKGNGYYDFMYHTTMSFEEM
ncbi:TPA_asm: hypothetical protein GFY42_15270, partial [Listeria monocytogenes]|nr:hypothetical protein [Listeria monocytogenes]